MSSRKVLLAQHGTFKEWLHLDESQPDKIITTQEQDCSADLAFAKDMRDYATLDKDFKLAARIPQFVIDQAHREGWYNDKAKWKAWANDPSNAMFRVWPGRL